jgi:hypothetical protein
MNVKSEQHYTQIQGKLKRNPYSGCAIKECAVKGLLPQKRK